MIAITYIFNLLLFVFVYQISIHKYLPNTQILIAGYLPLPGFGNCQPASHQVSILPFVSIIKQSPGRKGKLNVDLLLHIVK